MRLFREVINETARCSIQCHQETRISTVDVYRLTDQLPETVLDVMADRLEGRGRHPRFIEMREQYLDAMEIDAARTVLVVGCGTGVIARAIARRPGFAGSVTGVDLSPRLISMAQQLAADEDIANRVHFEVGDARALALPDEAFDAVVAHTLLSHVEDPLVVLDEAARVVKRASVLGIFDGDFASLTFSHEDPDAGKRYDEAIQQAMITNPRVMRQMPALLHAAGLEVRAVFPSVFVEVGTAEFWAAGINGYRTLIPQAGTLSEARINAWADARLQESAAGTFFGACTYYAYVTQRSARPEGGLA